MLPFRSAAGRDEAPGRGAAHKPGPISALQGYLAHKKHPPPQDHHRSLGMLLKGRVLMSEVPLYLARDAPSPSAYPFSAVVEGGGMWAIGGGAAKESFLRQPPIVVYICEGVA